MMPRLAALAAPIALTVALGFAAPAQARTLDQINSLGSISLCANPDALPYSADNSDKPGFQVEIARAIAAALGVGLRVDWLVPKRRVREVNCDMLLDNPSDPKLYEDGRLLSRPYQLNGIALALAPDAPDVQATDDLRKQRKIGVMIGSLASVVIGKAGGRLSPYAFQLDMLDEVGSELSAAAVSAPTLGYYMQQHPDKRLRAVTLSAVDPQFAWPVSVGLRNADEALRNAVDDVLAKMLADGTLAGIYARYGITHRAP